MVGTKDYDYASAIIAYEAGDMHSIDDITELFQHLVDNNIIGELQGSYGRTAQEMIKAGMIHA